MKIVRESIFVSILRSFLVSFFAVAGVLVALVVIGVLISKAFENQKGATPLAHVQVLPNANYERPAFSPVKASILEIDIRGVIGTNELNADTIRAQLCESQSGALASGQVQGILLRINSPGGVATDGFDIYHAILEYKERFKIPVYAYVDGLCASAAMMIACAADKIYTNDASLIGSIGVYIQFFNVSDLMDKIGVRFRTLSEGKDKTAMNPVSPWKDNDDAQYKMLTRYFYEQFVDIVLKGRQGLDRETLVETMGAHIFTAPQAKDYHLVDEVNANYVQSLEALLAAANLKDKDYQVVTLKTKTWLSELFMDKSPLITGKIQHHLDLGASFPDLNLMNKVLFLYTGSVDEGVIRN